MKALVLDAQARTALVQEVDIPKPAHGEVLIRVQAIALNPVDALYVFNPLGETGRIVGSDFSGTVVADGGGVNIRPDHRVAGFLQGACSSNDRPGAFAEYLICPADLLWEISGPVSFAQAATVSLCALTAAQALFYRLRLPAPFEWESTPEVKDGSSAVLNLEEGELLNFFIYGASTSVALYAAQLIRRFSEASGRPIKLIGSASKARFSLLQSGPYFYNDLVDYRDSEWQQQALQLTGGAGFHYAFDCISEGPTVKRIISLLQHGGKIAIVRSKEGGAWDSEGLPPDVEPIYGAVWEGLGVEIQYQNLVVQPDADARRFAVSFYKWLSKGGKLQANPVREMPGGLDRVVQDGFALLGAGAMEDRAKDRNEPWMKPLSAEKSVYAIDEARHNSSN
ncbi:chaperonin 10-like protein [Bisporella sp. PMI_857]|nr:chaperonin 10-like protein [Bisporella sp. PMI_857]